MINLYKDGDSMAIETNAKDEHSFNYEFAELLSDIIEEGAHDGDWSFQLQIWLPQYVDICCKYRGYKNNVTETRVLLAGDSMIGNTEPIHTNKRENH